MNPSKQHHDSVADEQAALWAARLDGDTLDRAQRAELDAWLAQDPAHRALLSQYCQFSADLEEQVPALVSAGAVTMPTFKTERRRRWNFPLFAGIALAAAAAIAVTFFAVRPSAPVQHFAMASAQRSTKTLSDGTRVDLNANTSLRFETQNDVRVAKLAGGEALFSVTKDPSRPFFVETPAGMVRVTGTVFNVRTEALDNTFVVTVVEGSVTVAPSGATESILLRANDEYSSRINRRRTLTAGQLDDTLAWRDGHIVFYGTPLSEALARFAQYHGCAIKVAPEVASELVGGRHSLDDMTGFLAGLEAALPDVKVNRDKMSGTVTVTLRQ